MGIRLTDLANDRKTVTVAYGGDTMEVCYKPSVITPDYADRLQAAAKPGEGQDEQTTRGLLGMMLAPVIDWWDLLDDNDERIEPTTENMGGLPLALLGKISRTVMDDMNEGKE